MPSKILNFIIPVGQTLSNIRELPHEEEFGTGLHFKDVATNVTDLTVKAAASQPGVNIALNPLPNFTGLTAIPVTLGSTEAFVKHLNGIQVPEFSWEMWAFGAFQFEANTAVTGSDFEFFLVRT